MSAGRKAALKDERTVAKRAVRLAAMSDGHWAGCLAAHWAASRESLTAVLTVAKLAARMAEWKDVWKVATRVDRSAVQMD